MDLLESKSDNYSTISRHPWELARLYLIKKMIKNLTKGNNHSHTILDLGCGDAYNLSEVAKMFKNYNFIGIDTALNNDLIENLNTRYNNNRINLLNTINSIPNNTKVNIVLLNDVIEHIEDDYQFLKDLSNKDFITHETIFIITVPAFQSLFTNHDKKLLHFRRYNIKSLPDLIKNCNFSIIQKGYFYFSLLPLRILSKYIEIILKPEYTENKGISNWKSKVLIDDILKYILIIDSLILLFINKYFKLYIPGLSVYTIVKPIK